MKILTGDTLLEKVKELEGYPLSRVLTECGYAFRGKKKKKNFSSFTPPRWLGDE